MKNRIRERLKQTWPRRRIPTIDPIGLGEEAPMAELEKEDVKALIEHMQWRIEREEIASSDIMTRAGVLLGMTGVELAFISTGPYARAPIASMAIFTIVILVVTGITLVAACLPKDIDLGASQTLADVVRGEGVALYAIGEQLLKVFNPEERPLDQQRKITAERSRWLIRSYALFILAQIGLAILLIVGR